MNKVLCVYRGSCADGIAAAWAVHRALGDEVEFVAASYGDDPPGQQPTARMSKNDHPYDYPDLRGRDVLIVGFSYPLVTLRAMAADARSVLVLDHHKTAQEALSWLRKPAPTFKAHLEHSSSGFNIASIFDLDRSGAGIAWDYLHSGQRQPQPGVGIGGDLPISRPRIIDLIEDQALERFKYGDESRAFHAVLTSYDLMDLPGMFNKLDSWRWRARRGI